MEGCDGTLDGAPDELTFRRWARFGAGGAKLLWGEAVAIDPDARANTRQLLISDTNLASLEQLIALARKEHGPASDFLVGLAAHALGTMVVSDADGHVSRSGAAQQRPHHHRR